MRYIICFILVFSSLPSVLNAQIILCETSFVNPPDSVKPWVYWYFMGDQISKEGISKDLEQMHKVGIGGVLMFNISKGNESGPLNFVQPGVEFMSEHWFKLVKHAASESKRLGLTFGMHNSPGWSASGGPWIKPHQAMQFVTADTTSVTGQAKLSIVLPKPPTGLGSIKQNDYWDIAVLAFPSPKHFLIDNWDAKAGFKRDVHIKPDTSVPDDNMIVPREKIIDLSSKMDTSGLLMWNVPDGQWTILRIGYTPTGATSSVPPAGGRGLECDKLNRDAVKANWDGMFKKVLDTLGSNMVSIVHIDSYERGCQNWTPNFKQEFQKRRGYDLTSYLPAMAGFVVEDPDVTERFLWDVRQTIGDLFSEEYYGYMAELASKNGMMLSAEPYGNGGFRNISIGGKLDIPMGEYWTAPRYNRLSFRVRDPASSAHLYGKKVISVEAFTSEFVDIGSGWQAHPYILKPYGDIIHCAGANHFTLHVYCHQPFIDRLPGYSVRGYGVQFGWQNTWWSQSSAWMKYIARCNYMLQQGLPVVDVLKFCGEDTPSDGGGAYVDGTAYDVCDADVILNRLSVKNGRIVLPDGMNYKLLILEKSEILSLELLQKIGELVYNGATIIGKKPLRSAGLKHFPESDRSLNLLAEKMWGNIDGNTIKMNTYGAGKVYYNESPDNVLASLTVPDFQKENKKNSADIIFTHRQTDDADVYFLSNQKENFETVNAKFRVNGKFPEIWHPETGQVIKCPVYSEDSGRITMPLLFHPYESFFVVFRSITGDERQIGNITHNGESVFKFLDGTTELNKYPVADLSVSENGGLNLVAWESGKYKIDSMEVKISSLPKAIQLKGLWQVYFPKNLGAPDSAVFNNLESWTENTEKGIKYFSGTATYVKKVTIPVKMIQQDRAVYLDLGNVKNIAEVEVNGKFCGLLWKPPFRTDITDAIKKGRNILKIKVTNNWPNRIIGDKVLSQEIVWKTWDLFYTADSPLQESGLLGPVEIRTAGLWKEF
jgi:hypothetical protein